MGQERIRALEDLLFQISQTIQSGSRAMGPLFGQPEEILFKRASRVRGLLPLGRIAFAGDQGDLARDTSKRSSGCQRPPRLEKDSIGSLSKSFVICSEMGNIPKRLAEAHKSSKYISTCKVLPLECTGQTNTAVKSFSEEHVCLEYENLERPVLDPDTLQSERLIISSDRLARGGMPDDE